MRLCQNGPVCGRALHCGKADRIKEDEEILMDKRCTMDIYPLSSFSFSFNVPWFFRVPALILLNLNAQQRALLSNKMIFETAIVK